MRFINFNHLQSVQANQPPLRNNSNNLAFQFLFKNA